MADYSRGKKEGVLKMATLFGIDGGLLNSILSKALATGEATFRTSEPHDELRKSAKFRNCNGDCLWCGMTPLYIGVDAENKCVEFKTFGRDFITSYKVDADGLRVDKGGKIILANKAARLIARAADKQDFYEFSIDKGYVDVISGNTTLTFKAIKDKIGDVKIIAEDLGMMTDEVIELRDYTGFPGMKILEFAFGGEDAQAKLLMEDGIEVVNGRVDLGKYGMNNKDLIPTGNT